MGQLLREISFWYVKRGEGLQKVSIASAISLFERVQVEKDARGRMHIGQTVEKNK